MSTTNDMRMLAFHLVDVMTEIADIASSLPESTSPFQESAFIALGNLCDLFAAICLDVSQDTDIYFDFGPEPITQNDAIEKIGGFLASLQLLATAAKTTNAAFPLPAAALRAQTYACLLADAKNSNS